MNTELGTAHMQDILHMSVAIVMHLLNVCTLVFPDQDVYNTHKMPSQMSGIKIKALS